MIVMVLMVMVIGLIRFHACSCGDDGVLTATVWRKRVLRRVWRSHSSSFGWKPVVLLPVLHSAGKPSFAFAIRKLLGAS